MTGDMVIEGDYLSTGGYALADSVIAGGFTAVFCENDMTAIGLYRRFRERGITVGQDISVVGFDDISFCEMLDTPLTTIRQSGYDIGYEACSRAMRRSPIRSCRISPYTLNPGLSKEKAHERAGKEAHYEKSSRYRFDQHR